MELFKSNDVSSFASSNVSVKFLNFYEQADGGTVELFKSNDVSSFASSNVSVRLGNYSDGQIVCGDEILQTEPFEVSADSEEVYLITRDNGLPGPPPAVSTTGTVRVSR